MSARTWTRIIRDLVEVAVKQERELQMQRKRAQAEDAAEERVLDILVPPPRAAPSSASAPQPSPDNTARQVMRKRLREGAAGRQGDRDRPGRGAAVAGDHGPAGHGGDGRAAEGPVLADLGQGKRKTRKLKIAEALKLLVDEEAGKLVNEDEIKRRRAGQRRAQRHRLHRRDRQGGLAQRARRRRRVAPGRAARPAAAGRGHHGQHQVRHGQDRPHPVHRLGRLPPRQAQRPDPRAAGPLPDPRRAGAR